MFCPKCGTQLEDGSYNCTSCDWAWQETEQELIGIDEENSTTPIEGESGEEIEKTNTNEGFIADNNLSNISGRIKANSKKVKIIGLICFVLVVSIIIGVIVYYNSDSYKIKKASELIVAGQYAEGVNKIYDVYTPQAIVIKNFVEVENAKQIFVNTVENNSIADACKAYDEFKTIINEFDEENEIYYLPDNIRKNYDCYRAAFDFIAERTEISENSPNEMIQALYDVQNVMMNEVDKNNSSKDENTFTLDELQYRVDISRSALQILNDYDFSDIEVDHPNAKRYCNTSTFYSSKGEKTIIHTSNSLSEMIDSLIYACEFQIDSSQEFIDETSQEFEMDADLYKNHPIEDYSSYIGANLENVRDYENINNNVNIILKTLRKDMLYFLIVGSRANQDN